MSTVPEKDWKLFRKLESELTASACEMIFKQVEEIARNRNGKEHQSYLDLYRLIEAEDLKLAIMY